MRGWPTFTIFVLIVLGMAQKDGCKMKDNFEWSAPLRAVRHFVVFDGPQLALQVEGRPGTLLSTAGPNPAGPVPHPFVNGQAMRAASEHILGQALNNSKDFDSFLAHLLDAGMNIFSYDMTYRAGPLGSWKRIFKQGQLVGVVCDTPGQFTSLAAQPEAGLLVSGSVSMTAYAPEETPGLLHAFQEGNSYENVQVALTKAGYELR